MGLFLLDSAVRQADLRHANSHNRRLGRFFRVIALPFWYLAALAVIQGITEFLPISSSAHLILPQALTGLPDQGPIIDVAVHVGSLLAVFVYFRDEVAQMLLGLLDTLFARSTTNARLFLFVAIATVPTVVVGGILYMTGVVDLLRDERYAPAIIGWTTLIFGLVLLFADRTGPLIHKLDHLTFGQAMRVGLAQVLALVPGVSRAGITMTAARHLGFVRADAARLSILLAIPTILMFGLLGVYEIASHHAPIAWAEAGAAVGLSFLAALATIVLFIRFIDRLTFTPYVIYRLLLGSALLAYVYL